MTIIQGPMMDALRRNHRSDHPVRAWLSDHPELVRWTVWASVIVMYAVVLAALKAWRD